MKRSVDAVVSVWSFSGKRAVIESRRWVADLLGGRHNAEDIVLVADELVMNVVQHTRDESGELTIIVSADGVRVEVRDDEPTMVAAHRLPAPGHEGRRGLFIVQCISSRWGCEEGGTGKVVWAEFDEPGDGSEADQ
jgi:anti-sigma regulatory factor (Ser/Thr protein kinase)